MSIGGGGRGRGVLFLSDFRVPANV